MFKNDSESNIFTEFGWTIDKVNFFSNLTDTKDIFSKKMSNNFSFRAFGVFGKHF